MQMLQKPTILTTNLTDDVYVYCMAVGSCG